MYLPIFHRWKRWSARVSSGTRIWDLPIIHYGTNLVTDRWLCWQAGFLSIDSTRCHSGCGRCNNTLLWHWRNFRFTLIHHNISICVQSCWQWDGSNWTVIKLIVMACRSQCHCSIVPTVDRWANMGHHRNKTIREWCRATVGWLRTKEPCKIQSLRKWNMFSDLSSHDAESAIKQMKVTFHINMQVWIIIQSTYKENDHWFLQMCNQSKQVPSYHCTIIHNRTAPLTLSTSQLQLLPLKYHSGEKYKGNSVVQRTEHV